MISRLALLLLPLLLSSNALAQALGYTQLPQSVVEGRLEKSADKNPEREALVKQMFSDAGCAEHLSEAPVSGERLPNVVCVLEGKTDKQIIVGAHFDKVEDGHGIVDNWSGATMLVDLFESLRARPREHTLVFVAFMGEEKGLVGSHAYVRKLNKEDRRRISAMINFDTLGLGPTVVWQSHADKDLADLLLRVALYMKLPLSAVNVEQVGSTDSESFREAKIPSMTVHSLTNDTLGVLHSSKDQLSAIKQNDYYETYRLLAMYLAYLDVKLDAAAPAVETTAK